jgi:hypothetical protein
MTILSEDPTYLAGTLAILSASFFIAVRVTQQGKYLVWALIALGLSAIVVVIEQLWVTDNERIERVVYALKHAVLSADTDGVLRHLTADVEYVQGGTVLPGDATTELIRSNLANSRFDSVYIRELQTSAGRQTRRGKAEFRVYAKGRLQTPMASYDVGMADSTWSLGLQETSPGVWKVNRITPVAGPEGIRSMSAYSQSRWMRGRDRSIRPLHLRGPFRQGGEPGPKTKVRE